MPFASGGTSQTGEGKTIGSTKYHFDEKWQNAACGLVVEQWN